MKTIRPLAAAIVLLGLSAPALAGEAEGVMAYQLGDYATALRELQPAAATGSVRAQTMLGFMYATGKGVAQDTAQGMKWLGLAAGKGDAEAQYDLGYVYDKKISGGFKFDTSKPGNRNTGHLFDDAPADGSTMPGRIGPKLSPDDRRALIEFLKTM